jgi:hypothetical protein
MLYNRCTGIYKFGNNTYPRRIRRRSNLDRIFREKKSASYGPGNTVRALNHYVLIIHGNLQISFDIILSCQLKVHVEYLRIVFYLFHLNWRIGGFLMAFYAASRRIKLFRAVTNSLDLEDEKKIKLFTSI